MFQAPGRRDFLQTLVGVIKEFDAKWGDPRQFVTASYRGLWLHVRALGAVV
jgi:hypothetical protein